MIRSLLTLIVALLLVFATGVGAEARACGAGDQLAPAAAAPPCHDVVGDHDPAPPADPGMDAACKAACAIGSVAAVTPLAAPMATPCREVGPGYARPVHVEPVSADLASKDPPPRRFA